MPKYSIKAGKALSGFGSHLRNIIRDVAKQRYMILSLYITQLQGAKDEKTLKKYKFQCLLRMWRGGVRAVCSK